MVLTGQALYAAKVAASRRVHSSRNLLQRQHARADVDNTLLAALLMAWRRVRYMTDAGRVGQRSAACITNAASAGRQGGVISNSRRGDAELSVATSPISVQIDIAVVVCLC